MTLHPLSFSSKKSQLVVQSFIPNWDFCTESLIFTQLYRSLSVHDKLIKHWSRQLLRPALSSQQHPPSCQLHCPAPQPCQGERPAAPEPWCPEENTSVLPPHTICHILKEILVLSLKMSNFHKQWKFLVSDCDIHLWRNFHHKHVKDYFPKLIKNYLLAEQNQQNISFWPLCREVLVSSFFQYLFSEAITISGKKINICICWFYLLVLAHSGPWHNVGNIPSDQQGLQMLEATC